MKNIVQQLPKNFFNLSLDKKIKILVSASIVMVTVVLVLMNSLIFGRLIVERTTFAVEDANTSLAQNAQAKLELTQALYYNIGINDIVQDYLSLEELFDIKSMETTVNVTSVLQTLVDSNPEVSYLAIKNNQTDYFVYAGKLEGGYNRFITSFEQDFPNSLQLDNNAYRISQNNSYLNNTTLSFYIPLYDTMQIASELGMLCIGLSDFVYDTTTTNDLSVTYDVIDGTGKSLGVENKLNDFSNIPIVNNSGSVVIDNHLHVYEKIAGWPYYAVASVSQAEVSRSTLLSNTTVLIVAALVLIINLIFVDKGIGLLYKPLKVVVEKMQQVSDGDLSTKITETAESQDLKTVTEGFNSMMDRIELLMEQVSMEEKVNSEIRLKLLQSQIQPHFLYNTLECIHWQAKTIGDEKNSRLIKSLSKFYRICLSDGEDLIDLSREMEHSLSYVVIQNIRYGDILELRFNIPPELMKVKIPKISLQPLIENSIYHGIKIQNGRTGVVTIDAKQIANDIIIKVSDNGIGMSIEDKDALNNSFLDYDNAIGFGIVNVHRRLQMTYGGGYGLHYELNESGGVSVTMKISSTIGESESV